MTPLEKWEYKYFNILSSLTFKEMRKIATGNASEIQNVMSKIETEMNRLGSQGWEYVPSSDGVIGKDAWALFKRRVAL